MGLSDGTKGFFFGFAVGFGAGAVFRDHLPELGRGISPLFKMSLKSIILMTEKSRELTARMVENVQDLTAEVINELKTARQAALSKGRAAHHRPDAGTGLGPDLGVIGGARVRSAGASSQYGARKTKGAELQRSASERNGSAKAAKKVHRKRSSRVPVPAPTSESPAASVTAAPDMASAQVLASEVSNGDGNVVPLRTRRATQ